MAIELDRVSFRYGNREVVRPTSVSIDAGEVVFVVGPNGAGKSTLLRLIAGLIAPASGTIRCLGLDPAAAERQEVARKLAFLPQSYELTFPFTVSEVVLLGRFAHGRRGLAGFLTSQSDRDHAERAMKHCDILELRDRRWNELSGGEQRRALLAQAFCQETPLLLLDEPTASLDPAHAIDIFETVRGRSDQSTTVVVTHDLNLAARYGDRLLLISDGELVSDGKPKDVLEHSAAADAFGTKLHVGTLPGTETFFVVPR